MPAKSKAQQRLMAIALHHPEKLYSRNCSLKNMSKRALREYAETPTRDLPKRKGVKLAEMMRRRRGESPARPVAGIRMDASDAVGCRHPALRR